MPLFNFFFFLYFFLSCFIMNLNQSKNTPGGVMFIPGFSGGYLPNNSNNVTNRTSTDVVAATISNKFNVSVPTDCALSGMCYCGVLSFYFYFSLTHLMFEPFFLCVLFILIFHYIYFLFFVSLISFSFFFFSST